MASTQETGIIKSDGIGRVRYSQAYKDEVAVYVALKPCDMRKSFDGLAAVARNTIGMDPSSGAAFLFTNQRRNLIKILYFDGTGYWVVAKSHTPQCPHWFISKDPLSVSSLV